MTGAARITDVDDGACGETPRATEAGSGDVIIDGLGAHRKDDIWPVHGVHSSITIEGSADVIVNGKQLSRVGDGLDCGANIASGSTDVTVN